MLNKLIPTIALAMGLIGQATLAGCGEGCCADECGTACCERNGCDEACLFRPEVEQEERHCWCTESKEICIPKVVCPWKKGGSGLTLFSWMKKSKKGSSCCDIATCCETACCCDTPCSADCKKNACGCDPCACALPRCGKIKRVCDLRKEKYEVDVCKWKQDEEACGLGCCGTNCCDEACGCEPSCGCDTGCCESAPYCGGADPSCGLEMCGDVCGCGN